MTDPVKVGYFLSSTLQLLTLPCGIPAAGHRVDSIYPRIEDNIKSRSTMQSIQYNGFA
jgi:hypothetical protein